MQQFSSLSSLFFNMILTKHYKEFSLSLSDFIIDAEIPFRIPIRFFFEVSFPGTTSASRGGFPKAPCYLGLSRHNFTTQIKNHGTFNQLQWSHIENENHRDSALVLRNAIQAATGQVQRTACFEYAFNS